MEEVAPQQHQVGAIVRRDLEHLLKGDEGVVLADLILLPHTLQVSRQRGRMDGVLAITCWAHQGQGHTQSASCGGARKQSTMGPTRWLSVDTRMRNVSLQQRRQRRHRLEGGARRRCGTTSRPFHSAQPCSETALAARLCSAAQPGVRQCSIMITCGRLARLTFQPCSQTLSP